MKTRYVAEGQQVLRADRESCANPSLSIETNILATIDEALPDVDIVVLSDYAKGVLSGAVTAHTIAAARTMNKRIVVDPKTRNLSKYRGATILTPNRHELQMACGRECATAEQIVAGARQIMKEEICSAMIVTRGADGMTVIQDTGAVAHLPTTARDVFDVSGAGDTAIATLALCLVCGLELVEAAAVANTAAGLVVTKRGTALVGATELASAIDHRGKPPAHEKIHTHDSAVEIVRQWRQRGMSVAFTNGCFDLLHAGHIHLVSKAKTAADRLIVAVNADESVRRLKGAQRPVQPEATRAVLLASLEAVDGVVIFGEDTPRNLIQALQPDVLIKGADYAGDHVVGAEEVTQRGGRVLLVDLLPGYSTTGTLQRLPRPWRVLA